LRKQQRSLGIAESELVKIAVHSLGLSDLAPTVLELLGLPIPEEMTGRSLIVHS